MMSTLTDTKDRIYGHVRGDFRRRDLQQPQGCSDHRGEISSFPRGAFVVRMFAQLSAELREQSGKKLFNVGRGVQAIHEPRAVRLKPKPVRVIRAILGLQNRQQITDADAAWEELRDRIPHHPFWQSGPFSDDVPGVVLLDVLTASREEGPSGEDSRN